VEEIVYRLITTGIGMVVIVLVLGCGASGDEAATAQVTKAEFIKQAKKVCDTIQRERRREVLAWEKNPPGGNADGFKELIAPSLKKEAEELEAIGGPEQFEPMIKAIAKAGAEIAQQGPRGLDSPSMEAYKADANKFHILRC
jgi:hypothetical protein